MKLSSNRTLIIMINNLDCFLDKSEMSTETILYHVFIVVKNDTVTTFTSGGEWDHRSFPICYSLFLP